MSEKYRREIWQLMGERGSEIDAFIAVSDYYSEEIRKKMTIHDDRISTVHLGVDTYDYLPKNINWKEPVIGFISRMCEENGLAVLVDAFILLKRNPAYSSVKLKITGGNTDDDLGFIKIQKKKLHASGLDQDVEWDEEFGAEERRGFFDTVKLISVPVLNGEAFGLYLLEALASGIPVVQPALGAFPEVVGKSEGGLIYSPNDPVALAEALGSVILDGEKLNDLSIKGISGIKKYFDIYKQAEKMVKIYEEAIRQKAGMNTASL
jgi:glycosyltransferase involved in cell wall biosynthesis